MSAHRPLSELAHRAGDGMEVTLLWDSVSGGLTVCVRDYRRGAYFEIAPEPDRALDVFRHPFAYAAGGAGHHVEHRLAA